MNKNNKKFKEANSRRLHRTLNKIPLSLKSRHIIKAVEPVHIKNMGKMFAKYTNLYPNARGVRVNNTGIREIDFELRPYFQHIKDNLYKCLICNSTVIKKYEDAYMYFNEDNTLHRKKIKGYFVCRITKNMNDKPRVKHIGRFKPQDNTFMVIE